MLHCIVVQHRLLNQHQLQHLTRHHRPSIQPIQESPQQAAQQTAQQQSVKNDTAAEQVSVAKPKSVSSKTIKAAKKKYYVRIRTYKIVNGKKVYSAWSKVKSVKTK